MRNRFSCVSRFQLKSILTAFFNEDELNEANDQLFTDAARTNVDGLPRSVKSARGDTDSRPMALAEDLSDMFVCLDEKGALASLPVYVARNLGHKLEDTCTHTHTHTPPFYSSLDFVQDNPGELIPEGTFCHLLDFLVQNEDNTGRHTNNPDGLPPHPD